MCTHPEVTIHDRTHISQQDTEVMERSLILVHLPATDDAVADGNRRRATDALDHRKVTPTAVTRPTLTLKTDTHYTIYEVTHHENGHSQPMTGNNNKNNNVNSDNNNNVNNRC